MSRFILQFDAGGYCDLCHEGAEKDPLKRTIRLIEANSCNIVLTLCYVCIIGNFFRTLNQSGMVEKEIMKDFYIFREENKR